MKPTSIKIDSKEDRGNYKRLSYMRNNWNNKAKTLKGQ